MSEAGSTAVVDGVAVVHGKAVVQCQGLAKTYYQGEVAVPVLLDVRL